MQSFFENRGTKLDTTLPSVRHIQELIRTRTVVNLSLISGQEVEGVIKWQDMHFVAVRQSASQPLMMVSREAISVLRALL
ncbi:MAG: Hfq-related RNA-binding protein [Cyanobacteriota bacterium]|jgi:host factor-I protein